MTNKTIGFEIRFEGFTELVKLNDELKAQKKILEDLRKTQGSTSEAYQEQAEKVGKLQAAIKQKKLEQSAEIAEQKKATLESEKATKQTNKEVSAYDAKSRLLNMLRKDYKDLAASERGATEQAQKLLIEIQKLDKELKDIDMSVGQHQRKVGEYSSAFEGLGSVLQGDLSGALGATGAGLAAVAAIEIGTQVVVAIKEITDGVIQLRGEVQQLTGATEDDLKQFTGDIASIAKVFKVETNDVLLAANALSKNTGATFSESLKLIEQGFLSGANANGEFLDTVKEYPTFFGGASDGAEEFIGLITQQVKSGVFSDKGIDAFKEANLSLSNLSKAATDALKGIGITSIDLKAKIDKDGIGGAIALVSEKMGKLGKDSPAVQKALADVFKSAGEDVGAQFIIDNFSQMDTKMVDLIDTTNQLTVNQQQLLKDEKEWQQVQSDLTDSLSGTGINLDSLLIQVKTLALEGLVSLINIVKDTINIFKPFFDIVAEVVSPLFEANETTSKLGDTFTKVASPIKRIETAIKGVSNAAKFASEKFREFLTYVGLLDKENNKTEKSNKKVTVTVKKASAETEKQKEKTKELNVELSKTDKAKKGSVTASKDRTKQVETETGSIRDLTNKISMLRTEIDNTSDENKIAAKLKEIANYEKQLEVTKQKLEDLSESIKRAEDKTGVGATEIQGSTLPSSVNSELVKKETDKAKFTIENYLKGTARLNKDYTEKQKVEQLERLNTEFENEKLFFTQRLQALNNLYEKSGISDVEYAEKRKQLLQEVFDYSASLSNEALNTVGSINTALETKALSEFETRQESELMALENRYEKEKELAGNNAAKLKLIDEKYAEDKKAIEDKNSKERELIEQKYAKRKQRLAILQAIIDGATGIVKTAANLGYPLAIPFQILQGIQTAAQIATIKAQKFAQGGKVGQSNIARQANGDSVLATLKPNEFVLTEADVNRLGGASVLQTLTNPSRFGLNNTAPSVNPRIARESTVISQSNNDAVILELVNAVNNRIDRIEVIADAAKVVKTGQKQLKKVSVLEV